MSWVGRLWLGLFVMVVATIPAGAQRQGGLRPGLTAVVVASDPVFAGGGVSAGLSLSSEVELVGAALAGRRASQTVARGEFSARIHFARPADGRRDGYLFGGVAAVSGSDRGGFLLIGAGVEVGRRARWFAEVGLGGGVRVAVGIRPRRRARPPSGVP